MTDAVASLAERVRSEPPGLAAFQGLDAATAALVVAALGPGWRSSTSTITVGFDRVPITSFLRCAEAA